MMTYQSQTLAWVCGTAEQPACYNLGLPIDSAPGTAAQEALGEQHRNLLCNAHDWAESQMATHFVVDQMALIADYTCRATAAAGKARQGKARQGKAGLGRGGQERARQDRTSITSHWSASEVSLYSVQVTSACMMPPVTTLQCTSTCAADTPDRASTSTAA